MVLCRRQIPALHRLMPETNTTGLQPEQVSVQVSQTRLAGLMSQLATLADYAVEVFTNILQDTNGTHMKIEQLATRVSTLQHALPNTRSYYTDKNLLEKMNKQVRTQFSSQQAEERELVSVESRPKSLLLAYNNCDPPPNFQKFPSCEIALKQYTNPQFFFERWVSEQRQELAVLKAERKKRRKEKAEARRIRRKAEEQAKAFPCIQRVQYDPTTGKAIDVGPQETLELNTHNAESDGEGSEDDSVKKLTVSQVHKVLRKAPPKSEIVNDWFGESTSKQPPGLVDTSSAPPPVPRRTKFDIAPADPFEQAPSPMIPPNVEYPNIYEAPLPPPPVPQPPSLEVDASESSSTFHEESMGADTVAAPPVAVVSPPPFEQLLPHPQEREEEGVVSKEEEQSTFTANTVIASSNVPVTPSTSSIVPSSIVAEASATAAQARGAPPPPRPPPPPKTNAGPPPPPPPAIGPPPPLKPVEPVKPIVVQTSALLEQIRTGVSLVHVEPQKSKPKTNNPEGFNTKIVESLLKLRRDVASSSSLSDSEWDEDADSEEQT